MNMNVLRNSGRAIKALRKGGVPLVLSLLVSKAALRFPLPMKFKWKAGLRSEIVWWDDYFRTKGLWCPDEYRDSLDPDLPLQLRPTALLPPERDAHILDVGAGPLTYLGRKASGRQLQITAVDPLADEYDKILHKYGIQPVVRTQRLEAEDLTKRFSANTFDLCVAHNSLDHAHNPERAVLQMIDVVKRGRYVLLEHARNEAEQQKYSGLHQWNFDLSPDGGFLIRSKSSVTNMTQKYADRCTICCELLRVGSKEFLVTRILKK
jgi:SAM-dependent methyltransferase